MPHSGGVRSFAPTGLDESRAGFPTACAVGCVLAPLRGLVFLHSAAGFFAAPRLGRSDEDRAPGSWRLKQRAGGTEARQSQFDGRNSALVHRRRDARLAVLRGSAYGRIGRKEKGTGRRVGAYARSAGPMSSSYLFRDPRGVRRSLDAMRPRTAARSDTAAASPITIQIACFRTRRCAITEVSVRTRSESVRSAEEMHPDNLPGGCGARNGRLNPRTRRH